jgi:hypothetical protein
MDSGHYKMYFILASETDTCSLIWLYAHTYVDISCVKYEPWWCGHSGVSGTEDLSSNRLMNV